MTKQKLNADGLVPGQRVSFDEIRAAEKRRKAREEAEAENPAAKDEIKNPATLAEVDDLKRPQLLKLLKLNGVEKPKGKLDELQDQLKLLLFSGPGSSGDGGTDPDGSGDPGGANGSNAT